MKNWKAKTIIAGTILLLIVASVYYYIALPDYKVVTHQIDLKPQK